MKLKISFIDGATYEFNDVVSIDCLTNCLLVYYGDNLDNIRHDCFNRSTIKTFYLQQI